MMKQPSIAVSDQALVEQFRTGHVGSLAQLWKRHYRSGVRVARQYTTSALDEMVSKAFSLCVESQLAGRGLTGAFRPQFYATIRATARRVAVDAETAALSRTLTGRAFESLPSDWRAVLWYLEVEGLDPHEAAPLLGVSANATAESLYRARAGMRSAWLRFYSSDVAARGLGECEWTVARLELFSEGKLEAIDHDAVATHLDTCTRCAMIRRQVSDVPSRLALVMIPLVLGAEAGGRHLGLFGRADATPSDFDDVPPLPDSVFAA